MSQFYSIEDVRSLSELQTTPRFTSLALHVGIRFPATFKELEHDLKDAASYLITQSDSAISRSELKKRFMLK